MAVALLLVLTACTTPGSDSPAHAPEQSLSGIVRHLFRAPDGIIRFGPPAATPVATLPGSDKGSLQPTQIFERRWGVAAVWHGGVAPSRCARGSSPAVCLAQAMQAGGASPQAMAFARALNFQGYLSGFRYFGRVDLGTVVYPFLANDNLQSVLLNGNPPIIDVAQVAFHVDLRSNPTLAPLLAGDRFLSLSDVPPSFAGEYGTPRGGQRFIFRAEISKCHACRTLAHPSIAYDFGPTGRFLGARVVSAGLSR